MIRTLTKRVAAYAHGYRWAGGVGLTTYQRGDRDPSYIGQRATLIGVEYCFTDCLFGASLRRTWSSRPGGVGGMFLTHVYLNLRIGFAAIGFTLYLKGGA